MSLRTPYQLGRNKRRPQLLDLPRPNTSYEQTTRVAFGDASPRNKADAALSVALDLVQLVRLRALPRRANSREFGELPQRGTYGAGCCRS
jgi:hypothetical protein